MVKKNAKIEETAELEEKASVVPNAPAPSATASTAAEPARERTAPEPKRLSKGQRKHIRRLKQAGEYRPAPRR